MRVFKFGGASVKDAAGIRQVGRILQASLEKGGPIAVVLSAMGKTTNALEALLELSEQQAHYKRLQELYQYHQSTAQELLGKSLPALEETFHSLSRELRELHVPQPERYDRVVAFGEIASTQLLVAYLKTIGLPAEWVSAYDLIHTDGQHQEARVDWSSCEKQIKERLAPLLKGNRLPVTQGFIGKSPEGKPTTLGREGSDYTAAILSTCLSAQSVSIWKDVPGVLNADPKRWANPLLLEEIPYEAAAEMTYYGASVIHPKTIRPLASKGIPLLVQSFINPEAPGSQIGEFEKLKPQTHATIVKGGQTLLSLQAKDLGNISQKHLRQIVEVLTQLRVSINLMMNTAVSFSACIDTSERKLKEIDRLLGEDFHLRTQGYLELVTIMWPTEEIVSRYYRPNEALLSLSTNSRMQFVREEQLGWAATGTTA